MREAKFRARYRDHFVYFSVKDLVMINREGLTDEEYEILEHDSQTLEQFIGLHDKNGVEIYEGDIYKNSWNTYSVVEYFFNDGWQTTGHNTGDRFIKLGFKMDAVPKEIEIVGNIHDSPELLNG